MPENIVHIKMYLFFTNLIIITHILGTGTNACYMEKLEKVELWDGEVDEPPQVRLLFQGIEDK